MLASPAADVVARLRAAGCVFAEEEVLLLADAARTPAELDAMVKRRAGGLPLEHVLGWAQFCGLRIAVDPGVFVPRGSTEFLVALAAAAARGAARRPGRPVGQAGGPDPAVIVDLCCGCGAVGAALAASLGAIELHAADIDPAAVRCARRNLAAVGPVYEGDLYQPLPASLRGRVDVLAVHAPYVPTAAIALMPPEARDYEARVALDGGRDGLDLQRRVAAGAPAWLAPGGILLIETSERQAARTAVSIRGSGLMARTARSGETDSVVVTGTWPGPSLRDGVRGT